MGARCYDCGESFGRCYDHAGFDCPAGCSFGQHDCRSWDGPGSAGDLIHEVPMVRVSESSDADW